MPLQIHCLFCFCPLRLACMDYINRHLWELKASLKIPVKISGRKKRVPDSKLESWPHCTVSEGHITALPIQSFLIQTLRTSLFISWYLRMERGLLLLVLCFSIHICGFAIPYTIIQGNPSGGTTCYKSSSIKRKGSYLLGRQPTVLCLSL